MDDLEQVVPNEIIEQKRLNEVMQKETELIMSVLTEYLGRKLIKGDADLVTYTPMPKQKGKIRVRMRHDGNIVGIIKKHYDKQTDEVVLEFVKQYKDN